jgi:hypothetical protein
MQSLSSSEHASRYDDNPWIVISYTLPTEPSRKRVLVWRHLRKLGALYRDTGIWFLPHTTGLLEAVKPIVAEIQEMQGKVHAFVANDIEASQGDELRQAFNAARRDEYIDLLTKCTRFIGHVDRLAKAADFAFANVEELEEDLEKRRRTLVQLIARDAFGVEERYEAEAAIRDCEEALAGFVEQASLAG